MGTEISVGGGELLIHGDELSHNIAISDCCQSKIGNFLCDVNLSIGSMKVVLQCVYLVMFFVVVILGREELLKFGPGIFDIRFATPLFAGLIIKFQGTHIMISGLEDLAGRKQNISVGSVLDAVVDSLKV